MHLYFLTTIESILSTDIVAVVTHNSQVKFVTSRLSFAIIQIFIKYLSVLLELSHNQRIQLQVDLEIGGKKLD